MAASYPTSVWSPTTKVDNVDTILASHMNDVQNEVVAIEGALKTGFEHALTPKTSDGAALGSTALPWSDAFLASGAVLNFGNGNVTLTHSAGFLTSSGSIVSNANHSNSFSGNANGSGYSVHDIRNANATKNADTVALSVGLTGASDMTGACFAAFYDADGLANRIGSITAASATTVAYNTSSDARLKDHIADFTGALDLLARVSPRSFTWKADGHQDYGFVAQELREVYPYAVSGNPDDPTPTMGIDYGKLTPLLAAALKELVRRVEALERGESGVRLNG